MMLSFKVFAPTKKFVVDFWRPFLILVASLKNQLHIHMLLGNVIDQTNFLSFCAHQKIEVDPWRPF